MLSVALFAAVAVLLLQPSEAKDARSLIKYRAALLESRVISEKGEDTSSEKLVLKERVRRHGLPKTIGHLMFGIVISPFKWMWEVVKFPFNVGKTIIYAWNISKENKPSSYPHVPPPQERR